MKSLAFGPPAGAVRWRGHFSRVAAAAALGASVGAVGPATPVAAQTPPDSVFRDCPHCPKMVVVPEGSFLMGSPPSGDWRFADEEPQQRVTVLAAFAIGVYEVTFAEWDACVGDGGCRDYRPADEGWGRGRRPVTNVSWEDARHYTQWLSEETGEFYRLPSEAQWEYAARAGTQTARYWGEDAAEQCRYANGFDRNLAAIDQRGLSLFDRLGVNPASCSDGQGKGTAPVGSYAPNAFGLYDVIGNLTEWTDDCWNEGHAGRPENEEVRGSGDCSRRVLRGGTWGYPVESLRSAYRASFELDHRDNGLGFRVIRAIR